MKIEATEFENKTGQLLPAQDDGWIPTAESAEMCTNFDRLLHSWARTTPENTVINTKRALNHYTSLCQRECKPAFPLTEALVLSYIEERSTSVMGRTIQDDLTLLRAIDALAHNTSRSPLTFTAEIKLALKEAKAEDEKPKQARAVSYEDIEEWSEANIERKDELAFMRDHALFQICYDGLLRVSEAVALRVSDIDHTESTVTIRKSKTDQDKKGKVLYLDETTLEILDEYLVALSEKFGRKLEGNDPIFWSLYNGGKVRSQITVRGARLIISRVLAHLEGASGHSFRVGACVDMGINNITLPMIMKSGRWKSAEMPSHYMRNIDAKKSGMAQLSKIQNRKRDK